MMNDAPESLPVQWSELGASSSPKLAPQQQQYLVLDTKYMLFTVAEGSAGTSIHTVFMKYSSQAEEFGNHKIIVVFEEYWAETCH